MTRLLDELLALARLEIRTACSSSRSTPDAPRRVRGQARSLGEREICVVESVTCGLTATRTCWSRRSSTS